MLAQSVDREVANINAAVHTFAVSPVFADGDAEAMHEQGLRIIANFPGSHIIVTDWAGQQVVNTARPRGDPLPKRADPETWRRIFAEGRPVVSDLFTGLVTSRLVVTCNVPVFRNGRVAYDLAMSIPAARLGEVLHHHVPAEWVAVLLDGQGRIIARRPDGYVGERPVLPLLAAVRDAPEGILEQGRTRDGTPVYSAFSRLQTSGWVAAAGVPQRILLGELQDWLVWTVGGGLLCSGLTILLAWTIGRRIADAEIDLTRYAEIVETSGNMLAFIDRDLRFRLVNRAFAALCGKHQQEVKGQSVADVVGADLYAMAAPALHAALGGARQRLCHELCLPDGRPRQMQAEFRPFRVDGAVTGIVASLEDVTERKAAEDEIRSLAFYDTLSRLPNRRLLLDRLRQAKAAAERDRRHGALLFVDLDNFKILNDTRGHSMGDLLLREAARRLLSAVRQHDTVARLGGDEFVVLLEGLSDEPKRASGQAEMVGRKILGELQRPYDLGEIQYHTSASIGITLFAGGGDSDDELLQRADLAMYQAKAAGRNTLRFFDTSMQTVVFTRSALETELRQAIENRQLVLHYQPQVDRQRRLVGVEALVRWVHPGRGLVPPAEFIPLAEDTDMIHPLGRQVMEMACRQLAEWRDHEVMGGLSLAVNVSPRQFQHPEFAPEMMEILAGTGADPARLKLEVTENLLMRDLEAVIAKMRGLREIGVTFSLDDFGTGYSSLAYLKLLPFDQVKIDRSFVRDVLTDANDAAIAKAILALGKSLRLTVMAEGVESAEQWEFLRREGCDEAQGYYFGRPTAPDRLIEGLQAAGLVAAAGKAATRM